jgi:signal peptidase II
MWFVLILLIIADRLTKSWALGLTNEKIVNQFLSFGLTFNRGINWGLLNSASPFRFFLINGAIACVIIALAIFAWQAWKRHEPVFGYLLILAGALSNYCDRIIYGGVIDFIVLSAGIWSWPAFNIADAAILAGIGLVVLGNYKFKKELS